mgnify:CR=1 FL=1
MNIIGINTPCLHLLKHFFTVHMAGSTIRMGNHHYFLHTSLEDSDKQTANHTTERMGNDASCILDHFNVSVLNA